MLLRHAWTALVAVCAMRSFGTSIFVPSAAVHKRPFNLIKWSFMDGSRSPRLALKPTQMEGFSDIQGLNSCVDFVTGLNAV